MIKQISGYCKYDENNGFVKDFSCKKEGYLMRKCTLLIDLGLSLYDVQTALVGNIIHVVNRNSPDTVYKYKIARVQEIYQNDELYYLLEFDSVINGVQKTLYAERSIVDLILKGEIQRKGHVFTINDDTTRDLQATLLGKPFVYNKDLRTWVIGSYYDFPHEKMRLFLNNGHVLKESIEIFLKDNDYIELLDPSCGSTGDLILREKKEEIEENTSSNSKSEDKNYEGINQQLRRRLKNVGASNACAVSSALSAYFKQKTRNYILKEEDLDALIEIYKKRRYDWDTCTKKVHTFCKRHQGLSPSKLASDIITLSEHEYSFAEALDLFLTESDNCGVAVNFMEHWNRVLNKKKNASPNNKHPLIHFT